LSLDTAIARTPGRAAGVDRRIATGGALPTFASSAASYWLSVFPYARREICGWRARARRIPDPGLRRLAIETHSGKHRNLEGAAAFAAFVPTSQRRAAVRGLVAYQALFDYLDTLAEQPTDDPIAGGRRLNRALLVATVPSEPHADYYAHLRRDGDVGADGGYLHTLIATSRAALVSLPSFAAVADLAAGASERVGAYQSLNHGDGNGRHDAFDRWARKIATGQPRLRWWETGAAAGSTLDLLALIAAASEPGLEPELARELAAAYFPWVGALHSLLDSVVDREDDQASGRRGLIDYYGSPEEAAERISTIATEAVRRTAGLPGGWRHTLVVAAMTGFYASDLARCPSPYARLAAPAALEAMGVLARPTMLVFGARLTAARASRRLPAWLKARRPPCRGAKLRIQRDRQRDLESRLGELESQVFDFPLESEPNPHEHGHA
jgi:tetraprenyl-beta-curcumene synthase